MEAVFDPAGTPLCTKIFVKPFNRMSLYWKIFFLLPEQGLSRVGDGIGGGIVGSQSQTVNSAVELRRLTLTNRGMEIFLLGEMRENC